jgi:hypothetical protein
MSMPQIEIRFDRQKGNFGPVKNARINDAIDDFYKRMMVAAPAAWAGSNVPRKTGNLYNTFGIGRVKKSRGPGGTYFTLNMGVDRVKTFKPLWAGTEGESYYPKFVQEGTDTPIFGNNMPVRNDKREIRTKQKRDSKGRFTKQKQKLFVNSVKGQDANPYMDRFDKRMKAAARPQQKALGRKIKKIIEE